MARLLLVASALVTISHSFVVCPDNEQLPGYDRWWACPRCKYEPHPSTFPEYMVWLERNLRNGTLAWWHDPRMMRLCGQRAARQAALASQNRRPVVRRKPKKYRGPTRTPPASKRNDEPQEEEFGRHMKKWLEGEQVPLMPTE